MKARALIIARCWAAACTSKILALRLGDVSARLRGEVSVGGQPLLAEVRACAPAFHGSCSSIITISSCQESAQPTS